MGIDCILLAAEAGRGTADQAALPFLAALTVFVLAVFVGFEIITKIPPHPAYPVDVGQQCHFRHYAGRRPVGCRKRESVGGCPSGDAGRHFGDH